MWMVYVDSMANEPQFLGGEAAWKLYDDMVEMDRRVWIEEVY